MKKIGIIQSNYIPWKGYFHIIKKVDCFVFLDTVQYTKRDWRNRNIIKTPDGLKWLTVPNNGTQSMKINEVLIDNTSKWNIDHLKTLTLNYKKCKYFDYYYNFLETVYLKKNWKKLSDLNQFCVREISKFLNIKTIFKDSSEFKLKSGKNEMLVSIIKHLKGDYYVSGPSAKSYIDISIFEKNSIQREFMNYPNYTIYNQPWGDFNHNVSILDLLFCEGPDAPNFIWDLVD